MRFLFWLKNSTFVAIFLKTDRWFLRKIGLFEEDEVSCVTRNLNICTDNANCMLAKTVTNARNASKDAKFAVMSLVTITL